MTYRIAIASSDETWIDEHFGAAQTFHIYEVTDGVYRKLEDRNTEGISTKVELISDCRCVVCEKVGFHMQKELEQRDITIFDVSCKVEEALDKISSYFYKIDTHQSLHGRSREA